MTPLPPSPFNTESTILPVDHSTATPQPAPGVAVDLSFPSSPAPVLGSLNSGEVEPVVMPAYGTGDAAARTDVLQTVGETVSSRCEPYLPPAGYVLIEETLMSDLAARFKIWMADYERLREWERVELLLPPPLFLQR